VAIGSVGLLLGGCASPGAGPGGSEIAPSATVITAAPAESPSIEPSISAAASESPVAEPSLPEPPAGSIAVDGGDPVVGQLGSFTWMNSGSDAPWLPGSPIHVGAGESLLLTLTEPVDIASWTVNRAPAGTDGSEVIGMAEGSSAPVTFAAPPPGAWTVHVSVWFADDLGSAAYFWLVDVD
jgi:hypothetical protein